MKKSPSLIDRKSLDDCTVGEFLQVLASDEMLPGAGAAAGIALALAASCAGKAVAITLGHQDKGTAETAALATLQTRLSQLTETALELGRNDALQFRRQLEAHSQGNEARKLLKTDCRMLEVCSDLDILLNGNEKRIAANMKGDWLAARVLGKACREIHMENVHALENKENWKKGVRATGQENKG